MAITSKVSYSKKGTNSLKTIIPKGIAQLLDLEHGEYVEWDIENRNGEKVAILRKID
ncbi:MAG: hypothetical protein R6U44_01385 [Archaeoglobaceae archaeon]